MYVVEFYHDGEYLWIEDKDFDKLEDARAHAISETEDKNNNFDHRIVEVIETYLRK